MGSRQSALEALVGNTITLHAGEYELRLAKGAQGLRLSTDKFKLTRGDRVVVEVNRIPPASLAVKTSPPPSIPTDAHQVTKAAQKRSKSI